MYLTKVYKGVFDVCKISHFKWTDLIYVEEILLVLLFQTEVKQQKSTRHRQKLEMILLSKTKNSAVLTPSDVAVNRVATRSSVKNAKTTEQPVAKAAVETSSDTIAVTHALSEIDYLDACTNLEKCVQALEDSMLRIEWEISYNVSVKANTSGLVVNHLQQRHEDELWRLRKSVCKAGNQRYTVRMQRLFFSQWLYNTDETQMRRSNAYKQLQKTLTACLYAWQAKIMQKQRISSMTGKIVQYTP